MNLKQVEEPKRMCTWTIFTIIKTKIMEFIRETGIKDKEDQDSESIKHTRT